MTPIASRFYRSFYITLGFACACLGYAELVFLPEMAVLAGIVGILLFVAYRVEGRWSLTIRGANILGFVITLIASAYIAYQFVRPYGTSLIDTLPWPTSLLPYLGPLLMVLIPAKLFRPKHIGDIWSLQGIGLLAAALGCALAGDAPFGLLFLGYLISFVWSSALFYYYRQSRMHVDLSGPIQPRPWLLARSTVLTAVAMGAAFVVFLATPRFGDADWEFSLRNTRLQTGLSDERPTIDLNSKGVVALNRDLAFEVQAFTSDGFSPKTDLDPNQRWRAASFDHYEHGRWESRPDPEHRDRIFQPIIGMDQLEAPAAAGRTNKSGAPKIVPLGGDNSAVVPRNRTGPKLPNLGMSQVYLRYQARARNTNRIVAEPVFRPGADPYPDERRVSVVTLRGENQFPWYQTPDDYPLPPLYGTGGTTNQYMQVYLPHPGDDISPPMQFSSGFRAHLCNTQLPAIKSFTQELVRTLVKAGTISKAALGASTKPDEPIQIPPEHAEDVAKALRTHLAMSGEYSYSLNLERQDDRCDPVEDFLLNTKVGHCQRFATALVLMLRSVGVPARIVLGYRGYESDGSGTYEILQCHAHAWVEAIVQNRGEGEGTWHWLTLDPTPAGDDTVASGFSFLKLFDSLRSSANSFYRYFVIEYDSDQQARARNWFDRIDLLATLVGPDGTQWWRPVVVVAGIVGLTIFVCRRRTKKPACAGSEPGLDLYARVCDLIRRCVGIEPAVNQTPEEFAQVVANRLAAPSAALADPNLPAETVVVYYRVRFGRQAVSDTERSAMSERIDRFEADLGRRDLRLEPGAG